MAARSDTAALTDLCPRPCYNTSSGSLTTVFANHFRVTKLPNSTLYQYDVTIGKGTVKLSLSRRLWQTSYVQNALGENMVIFDGRHIAWCSTKLPFGKEIAIETTISGSDPKTANERDRLTVRITYSTKVNLEVINQFLLKRHRKDEQVLQGLTALNTLMRQTPTLKFFTMGNSKNFYSKQNAIPLAGALEAWKGIFQSLRPSQGFLTVNVDVATTVTWTGGLSLVDLVCKYMNRRDANDLFSMADRERHKLQQAIKGLTFYVTHRGEQGRRKVLTIKRLMKTNSITTTFPMEKDGVQETISIQRYMQRAYNKDIRYPQLFCVQSTKGDIFPLEFCVVHDGQRYNGVLSPEITSTLIKVAAMKPIDRKAQIARNVNELDWARDPMLRHYGLQVDTKMLSIQARLLPKPQVQFGNRCAQIRDNAQWDLRNIKFIKPKVINNWAIVIFETPRHCGPGQLRQIVEKLISCGRDLGMIFNVTSPIIENANSQTSITTTLQNISSKARQRSSRKDPIDFFLCIYSFRNTEMYNRIKAACDIDLGVACQVALTKNVLKASPQFACNLLLKINKKLGGVNSNLTPQFNSLHKLGGPTIVLGADVTHAAPGSPQPSLASLVSSMDLEAADYCAQGRAQDNHVEMIADLQAMVRQSLITFKDKCKRPPLNIMYFLLIIQRRFFLVG